MNSIHPHSDVNSTTIGEGTRIWQYVVVLPGAVIGAHCNICSHCFIENDVLIGDWVTVKCGVQLWDGINLQDDVFIGPNVTFTNDPFPRSGRRPEQFSRTLVERGASIGAGAVILPGITIGTGAMVGAGAVVTKSVPPHAIVVGSPARIVGYADTGRTGSESAAEPLQASFSANDKAKEIGIGGVTLHKMQLVRDLRGDLSFGEFSRQVPFAPKRYFLVFDVPSEKTRGEHAHRDCHQFLCCIKGSCSVVVDNGEHRAEVTLDSPDKCIYMPPLIWGIQYKISADAVLLVFASDYYDPDDYIRDYSEFLQLVKK